MEIFEALMTRRSIRSFTDREISHDVLEKILRAGAQAPSGGNRQPWRFNIRDDSITVSANSKREGFGVSRMLDCGIAMLHIELGVRKVGVTGSWEFLKYPDVGKFQIS